VFRQLGSEDDVRRPGDLADLLRHMLAKLLEHLERALLATLERDEGDDRLSGGRVGAAGDGGRPRTAGGTRYPPPPRPTSFPSSSYAAAPTPGNGFAEPGLSVVETWWHTETG
jgi:hypothetical protein